MKPTYTCSWCGRRFTKKGLIGGTTEGEFLNKVGLKKDYCSTACRTAAQQAGGASGGGGGGGGVASFLGMDAASQEREDAKREAEKQKRVETQQAVAGTSYGNDPAEIVATMQQTIAHSDRYKDDERNFEDVAKGVQQKLDEGLYLLRKNTEGEEDYYLQQGEKIKAEFDALVLKKRRAKRMWVVYGGMLLTVALLTAAFPYMPIVGLVLGGILAGGEYVLGRFVVRKFVTT